MFWKTFVNLARCGSTSAWGYKAATNRYAAQKEKRPLAAGHLLISFTFTFTSQMPRVVAVAAAFCILTTWKSEISQWEVNFRHEKACMDTIALCGANWGQDASAWVENVWAYWQTVNEAGGRWWRITLRLMSSEISQGLSFHTNTHRHTTTHTFPANVASYPGANICNIILASGRKSTQIVRELSSWLW